MIKIFVYGTLKKGFKLDGQCTTKRKHIIKNVNTSGTLFNLGPFPGAKFNTKNVVIGEIHIFEDIKNTLQQMDYIEGYDSKNKINSLFIRRKINVFNKNNKKIKAYAYEFNFDKYNIKKFQIKSGIWVKNY